MNVVARITGAAALLLTAAACGHSTPPSPVVHTLELTIKSDATQNDVAWSAGDKSGQDTEASGHWWQRYQTSAGPGTYTVSMDAQTGDYGTFITCTITEDGKVVVSNTSTGPYASVQCGA